METTVISYPNTLCSTSTFEVKIADSLAEIDAALRLRFEVFNLEMNEGLPSSYESGFDSDVYDTFCDHLIVKETATGKVVGTYRLLTQEKAERHIGFYSENEFDLSALRGMNGRFLELGRSCVAKPFRSLAVINLLWTGIARYLELHSITHLFGCASFHTHDPNTIAAAYAYLKLYHGLPDGIEIRPHDDYRMELPHRMLTPRDIENAFSSFPPLMKGYLRLGARIGGVPAFDKVFGTTDFLIIVETARIAEKYKRHYVKSALAA